MYPVTTRKTIQAPTTERREQRVKNQTKIPTQIDLEEKWQHEEITPRKQEI